MAGVSVDRGLEGVVVGETVYEEIVHLLLHGQLPTHAELHDLTAKLNAARALPSAPIGTMHAVPQDAWPMDVLRTALGPDVHPFEPIDRRSAMSPPPKSAVRAGIHH